MYFKNNRPIFFQIAEDIERKIYGGEYKAGQKLPSIRELGLSLGVNPNTVVRVYEELESRGLVRTESTSGKFVIDDEKKINELKDGYIGRKTREFVTEMKELGVSERDLLKAMKGEDENVQSAKTE